MNKYFKYLYVYGYFGCIKLAINLIKTKLIFNNARIIRFPIEIRGKKQIQVGKGFTTGIGCRIEVTSINSTSKNKKIIIGENVQINDYVHIGSINSITIKNNVLIASKVFITDHNHGNYHGQDCDSPNSIPIERKLTASAVLIEENVWIGEFVTILPGVTIGKGSIIGAMSLVNKNIPPFSIAVGSPAKVIKKYDTEKNIWINT